jgi:5-methylthioadenosine/S-adenosylhomocysteine deaminase
MTTLIRDTTVVTGDANRTVLYNAAIAIEDSSIAAIGPSQEVAARYTNAADVVDGRGKAVFPGMINCHTHLLAVADRSILEDFGFPTTLRFPQTGRSLLTAEERNVMVLLAAIEAIRSGTTCLLEISSDIPEYAESLVSTGLRLVLAENINDFDEAKARDGVYEFLESKLDAGLRRSADLIEKWHGKAEGRVTCFVAPHAPESCSPALLRRSRELAEQYGIGYTIHLSQSHKEIEAVMRTRGVRPTQYLFANGLLGPRLVAAHCRYVDASEVALLGHTGTAVSNNAAIAARRGAAAPASELLAAGCAMGMGSDNMAEDMVEVMRTGLFMERVRRNDEMWPWPEDVLEWATRGGARALGMAEQTGTLEAGKRADLFLIDTRRAHLVPTLRIVAAFVHQGQPADITDVMADGRWLMRGSKVLSIDEADIVRRAEQIGHAVWKRVLEKYPNVPFPVALPPRPLGS